MNVDSLIDALKRGHRKCRFIQLWAISFWKIMSFAFVFLLIIADISTWSTGGECCSTGYA